jgi:hypothetical protein
MESGGEGDGEKEKGSAYDNEIGVTNPSWILASRPPFIVET